jgi:uncharacterized damage-inducible protein DinB
MRERNTQLKLVADDSSAQTTQTDTSGNPSESYHWRHMAAVRREWQHEFLRPCVNAFELTVFEIMSVERRVRGELYP